MDKNNYFKKSLFKNIQCALGRNILLWFIPIGEGYEEEINNSISNINMLGYEFYVNKIKYKKYVEEMQENISSKSKKNKNNNKNIYY